MANVKFNVPVDMDAMQVWPGTLVQATAKTIMVTDGVNTAIYAGKGFTYSQSWDVVGGTLTGYRELHYGKVEFTATGLSVPAAAAYQYIDSNNLRGLFSLALKGADTLTGSGGGDLLRGYGKADHITGRGGADTLYGGGGNDTILGGGGRDELFGGGGNDRLSGQAGNDALFGGAGADVLSGGGGRDELVGGAGADILAGGGGRDVFRFFTPKEIGNGKTHDVVQDFEAGDTINLFSIDADTTLAGNQAFDFIGDTGFSGTAGELRVVHGKARTLVQGDVDGDGLRDFLLELTGHVDLNAGDFVL